MQGIAGIASDYEGYIAPIQIGMLAHSILNEKQFEELYWPYMKKAIDFCAEKNIRILLYCEAEVLRLAEFLQEIPKGLAILQHEKDDIFELRKRLPNMALMGGMPLDVLGNASPKECVDHAKKLIDTLGDGFVLCQNKMGCTKNDINRENLLAVNEFALNYNY
jgi:uroporphyrinogen-III decarboxylase